MRIANPKIIAVAALILLLPTLSSATRLTDFSPNGDCEGWSADVTIRFSSTIFEVDGILTVSLLDADGNVLETQVWEGPMSRDEDSYQTQLYSFGDAWTVVAPAGDFTVDATLYFSWTSPVYGFNEIEASRQVEFNCDTVANEAHTWSNVKSLYR